MASQLKIYGIIRQPLFRSVASLLIENGVEFTAVNIDPHKEESKTPEFLKINPLGQIPAIQHNQFSMGETQAILRYLCRAFKLQSYYNEQDVEQCAQIDIILSWYFTAFFKPVIGLCKQAFCNLQHGQQSDCKAIQQAHKEASEAMGALQNFFKGDFLCGQQPTIADLLLGHIVGQAMQLANFQIEPFQQINSWFQKLLTLKGFKQTHDQFAENIVQMKSKQMLTIYGIPLSPFYRAVTALLYQYNIDFKQVPFNPHIEAKTPEFLKINPAGSIPTIVEGNFSTSESQAIQKYLVRSKCKIEKYWYPENNSKACCAVDRVLNFLPLAIQKPLLDLLKNEFGSRKNKQEPNQQLSNELRPQIDENLKIVSQFFLGDFIAGEQPSIADLQLAAFITQALLFIQFDLTPYVKLLTWYRKMHEIPGFKQASLEFQNSVSNAVLQVHGVKLEIDQILEEQWKKINP